MSPYQDHELHDHPGSVQSDHVGHSDHDELHDHSRSAQSDHVGRSGHHPSGLRGLLHQMFVPHSHHLADSVDDELEASTAGIRAVKLSLLVLGTTAALQLVIALGSGSVALLADTIHNFSDALTALPLWLAFRLGRRPVSRRYTYGYGRVEDLAGLFIVAMIALSAILAGYESISRFLAPQPLAGLGWVLAAGLIGFAGNEVVALYRIRTGRRIGSAALVADGVHARADGFTSFAVVLGVIGVWAGFPLADPLVGLLISIAILVLLIGTARDIGRRLLDGVDPALVDQAETSIRSLPGITNVDELRMRWTGHRLTVEAAVISDPDLPVGQFHQIEHSAGDLLRNQLPHVGSVRLIPIAHPTSEPTG